MWNTPIVQSYVFAKGHQGTDVERRGIEDDRAYVFVARIDLVEVSVRRLSGEQEAHGQADKCSDQKDTKALFFHALLHFMISLLRPLSLASAVIGII
jgi:hypothetical protein